MPGVVLGAIFMTQAVAADAASLAESCANCHGKDGASTEPEVPIIGGYSAVYITDTMTAYRNKERPCPEAKYLEGPHKGEASDMCKIAEEISEADLATVAEYFAAKPFVRAKQEFDPAKAAKGKQLQDKLCKKCHEDGGSSPDDDAGILAGQWMPYIERQFKEYSSGERPMPEKMEKKYKKLDAGDIENLVHYFGGFQ